MFPSPHITVGIQQEILGVSTAQALPLLGFSNIFFLGAQGNAVMVMGQALPIGSCDEEGLWCWKGWILDPCVEHRCPNMHFALLQSAPASFSSLLENLLGSPTAQSPV